MFISARNDPVAAVGVIVLDRVARGVAALNAGGVANAVNASPNAHVGTVAVAVRYPPNFRHRLEDFLPSPVMYDAGTMTSGMPAVIVTADAVGTLVVAAP
jgi:hypothetical protein